MMASAALAAALVATASYLQGCDFNSLSGDVVSCQALRFQNGNVTAASKGADAVVVCDGDLVYSGPQLSCNWVDKTCEKFRGRTRCKHVFAFGKKGTGLTKWPKDVEPKWTKSLAKGGVGKANVTSDAPPKNGTSGSMPTTRRLDAMLPKAVGRRLGSKLPKAVSKDALKCTSPPATPAPKANVSVKVVKVAEKKFQAGALPGTGAGGGVGFLLAGVATMGVLAGAAVVIARAVRSTVISARAFEQDGFERPEECWDAGESDEGPLE